MTWSFVGIFKRALQLPNGSMVAVSPAGTARLRYNDTTKAIEASIDGAAYAAFGNPSDIPIADNDATAFDVHQGANSYIVVSTVNGSEAITLGNTTTNPAVVVQSRAFSVSMLDNTASVVRFHQGIIDYLLINTTNGAEVLSLGADASANVTVRVGASGGDLGFYGTAGADRQDVSGARDDPEEALANLLTALAATGLITNSTTPT